MQNARQGSACIPHRWAGTPVEAVLESRPNRFLARCRLDGLCVEAHVPDRGRCLDLLEPGRPVLLVAAPSPSRRTGYTLLLARAGGRGGPWVSLDPAGAPRLVSAALEGGLLPSLGGLRAVAREVPWAGSRLDLLLADQRSAAGRRTSAAFLAADASTAPGRAVRTAPDRARLLAEAMQTAVLCEVKSVGAAKGGVALFPDAPTLRGVRHLGLLARRARGGLRAALIFCAQREDVRAIAADSAIDPAFARALELARRAGVEVAGLACAAGPEGMRLLGEVPVLG